MHSFVPAGSPGSRSKTIAVGTSGDAASANHVTARATDKHCSNDPAKPCTAVANCGGAGTFCDAPIAVRGTGKLKTTGSNTAVLPVGATPPNGNGPVMPAFGACPCDSGPPSNSCCAKPACVGSNDAAGCLAPCPLCGNHVIEFPETCDPAAGLDRCTGHCNQHCRAENCNDQNVCTTDTCDLALGCANEPVADGTPCPDADLCNGTETCANLACRPGIPLDWAMAINIGPLPLPPGQRYVWELSIDGESQPDWHLAFSTRPPPAGA